MEMRVKLKPKKRKIFKEWILSLQNIFLYFGNFIAISKLY